MSLFSHLSSPGPYSSWELYRWLPAFATLSQPRLLQQLGGYGAWQATACLKVLLIEGNEFPLRPTLENSEA